MMTLKKIRSLDSDKMCVTSSKILVMQNKTTWDTKKPLKKENSWYEC